MRRYRSIGGGTALDCYGYRRAAGGSHSQFAIGGGRVCGGVLGGPAAGQDQACGSGTESDRSRGQSDHDKHPRSTTCRCAVCRLAGAGDVGGGCLALRGTRGWRVSRLIRWLSDMREAKVAKPILRRSARTAGDRAAPILAVAVCVVHGVAAAAFSNGGAFLEREAAVRAATAGHFCGRGR